jgi:histone-lysine N-methyltransferase SETMAR
LKRRIERVEIGNEKLLQHDNAKPHTSAATRDEIQRLDFSVLQHPPYNPDLAPSYFHLFPKLKELKDGFKKIVQRWWKCIEVRDDFVEK